MRMRQVIARNSEALERVKESSERLSESSERQIDRFDRLEAETRVELRRSQEALQNTRLVTRSMVADMEAHARKMEREFEVARGAFVDLAAEIQKWRVNGGEDP